MRRDAPNGAHGGSESKAGLSRGVGPWMRGASQPRAQAVRAFSSRPRRPPAEHRGEVRGSPDCAVSEEACCARERERESEGQGKRQGQGQGEGWRGGGGRVKKVCGGEDGDGYAGDCDDEVDGTVDPGGLVLLRGVRSVSSLCFRGRLHRFINQGSRGYHNQRQGRRRESRTDKQSRPGIAGPGCLPFFMIMRVNEKTF